MRWLSDLAGSLRTSFGIGRATISSASLTAARTVTLPDRSIAIGDPWEFVPIGVPFGVWSHLAGVDIPPNDNPNYRYIKLTASDSYNTGVLTSESVSGSAPLVQATAVINDAGSPMDGETVRLINTERRVIRAGSSGVTEQDSLHGHTHGSTGSGTGFPSAAPWIGATGDTGTGPVVTGQGLFLNGGQGTTTGRKQIMTGPPFTDGINGDARTANETRPKNIGADYYMRIR